MSMPKCAEMSTKTFMLQIAVSQRPMAKLTRLKGLPVISREHFCKTRTNTALTTVMY
jgi:hypothetical protein